MTYYAMIDIASYLHPLGQWNIVCKNRYSGFRKIPRTKNTELSTIIVDNSVENCAEVSVRLKQRTQGPNAAYRFVLTVCIHAEVLRYS